jgi:hypothetical protein
MHTQLDVLNVDLSLSEWVITVIKLSVCRNFVNLLASSTNFELFVAAGQFRE